ncbi:hypothetical protein PT974_03632 [Cladobotryum mycophilum]|uniref:Uncharacterized protein n=1 Tax=Cladobotryum mycophilum TaxID=491253 RepID=A0ABR0SSZ7_9HYPO
MAVYILVNLPASFATSTPLSFLVQDFSRRLPMSITKRHLLLVYDEPIDLLSAHHAGSLKGVPALLLKPENSRIMSSWG